MIIRHAEPRDWPTVTQLGIEAFIGTGQRHPHVKYWEMIPREPGYQWEHSRLAIVDGQIAAHISFTDRVLRYGQVEIPYAGISGVYTHPDYRNQGLAAALMRDVLDLIEQRGYPLTLLDGISRFYDRFGYATLWPSRATQIKVSETQKVANSDYPVEPYHASDLPAVQELYQAEWGSRFTAGQRSLEWMQWRLDRTTENGSPYTYVVKDRAGVLKGYSCGYQIENRTEVVAADQAAVAALLCHSADLLADTPDKIIQWLDLPDTRASYCASRLCSVHYNAWANYNGGWMGRFVHMQKALDLLRPELIRQMQVLNIPSADQAQFEAVDHDEIYIQVGKINIYLPSSVLLQLLFGFLAPYDITGLEQSRLDLLRKVFPTRIAGLAGLDWF